MNPAFPLSRQWPKRIRSAMVSVVSLAHAALVHSRSWAVNSPIERVRLAADCARLKNEVSLLREEIRIKDARMARVEPKRRPYYTPVERLQILELRAALSLSVAQTARLFLVEHATILLWMKRVDAPDGYPLLRLSMPVNRFRDYVRYIVQRLKVLCPDAGKVRTAQILARAGLKISPSTVRRMWRKTGLFRPPHVDSSLPAPEIDNPSSASPRVVRADYPHHVWHVDLTLVPIFTGFWVPWSPFALLQVWPFCWWVAAVVDHFSRRAVAFHIFRKQPSAPQVRTVLTRAILNAKRKPKYIVSDKGSQFWCASFKTWCRRRRIRPRFGAVGKHGSIAVIERFFRSMKNESLRRVLVPLRHTDTVAELDAYVKWYNHHRPHQGLAGLTPNEKCLGSSSPNELGKPPRSPITETGPPTLVVHYLAGKKHLPIVELKQAA